MLLDGDSLATVLSPFLIPRLPMVSLRDNLPSDRDRNPFNHHFSARLLVLWFLGISLVLGMILGIVAQVFQLEIADASLILPLNALVWLLLCALLLLQMRVLRVSPAALVGRWPRDRSWVFSLLLVLPVLLFSVGSGQLFFYFLAQLNPDFVLSLLSRQVPLPAAGGSFVQGIVALVAIVVVAPITEEFVFRGVLLHRWAAKWGVQPAIVLSSLVFGLLHANIVGLTIFGAIVALVYLKTGSLWVAIACHACNNALAVTFSLLSGSNAPASPEQMLEQFASDWLLGFVCLVLSAPWLAFFIARNWPPKGAKLPYALNAPFASRR